MTMIHTLAVGTSEIDFSPAEIFLMILMPLVVAAFLIWYSKHSESKRWIS